MSQDDERVICSHLGLIEDRALYCLFPTDSNACYRGDKPRSIELSDQERHCLGGDSSGCAVPPESHPATSRAVRKHLALSVGVLLISLSLLALFRTVPSRSPATAPGNIGQPSNQLLASERATATRIATVPAQGQPLTPLGTSLSSANQPTASPPMPTTTATPTPIYSSQGTYIVAKGETLSDIAKKFGTSVDALVRANGIQNKDLVTPGQRLVVP